MAILDAMQAASMALVGERPAVFFDASDQFEQEIAALVNFAGREIARSHDWQALTKIATFTGDGVQEEFDKPADYDRMLLVSDIQQNDASWWWGYRHILDINEFLHLKNRGWGPFPGGWIMYGDKFHFSPAPGASQGATFPYISRNFAVDQNGVDKPQFTADTDTFKIDEYLLSLWLIWRWREQKKLDYTGDEENFVKAFDEVSAKDAGSKVIRRNWSRVGRYNAVTAWPWELGH